MPIHTDAFWLTFTMVYFVPILSGAVAILAAWFSGWAVVHIKEQIKLANDQIEVSRAQIKIAQAGLDLTRQEFNATVEVLDITKNKAKLDDAERARVPKLRLTINEKFPKVTVIGNHRHHQEDEMKVAFELKVDLTNIGTRFASSVAVEIVLPAAWDDNSAWVASERNDVYVFEEGDGKTNRSGFANSATMPILGDIFGGHKVGTRHVSRNIVPDTNAFIGVICASARPGTYALEWMAKTKQGHFSDPEQNPSGHARFEVTLEDPNVTPA